MGRKPYKPLTLPNVVLRDMRSAMTKDASLTLRLSAELKAKLEQAAKADGRSASNLAERTLSEALLPKRSKK